jgi:hypothetical protein
VGGTCGVSGGEEEHVQVTGRKARGKETTTQTKMKVVYNIKMDLAEIRSGGVDWIGLAQDKDTWRALVNVL